VTTRIGRPLRIGIVGAENTHVEHIVHGLNRERARPGVEIVGLAGGATERNVAAATAGAIPHLVDRVEAMVEFADALIVADRHGGLHREHARPFLELGRPVWIDKPLACDVADACAIIDTAAASGALLTSYSTLRHVPDTEDLVREAATIGELQAVVVSGPADPSSEYGGIFFYGIHMVDIALRLAPGPLGPIRIERGGAIVVATTVVGGVHVTVHFVRPDGKDNHVPFHAVAVGRTGIAAREIGIPGNYVVFGLDVFLGMANTGHAPLTGADMLRPIEFLATVRDAL
jgi:predicted dehydrogenase